MFLMNTLRHVRCENVYIYLHSIVGWRYIFAKEKGGIIEKLSSYGDKIKITGKNSFS